jgi:alpha-soluble NSF attachment protein
VLFAPLRNFAALRTFKKDLKMTKGDDLYQQALNAIKKSSSLLSKVFGQSEVALETAADLLKRSATAFKLEKNYARAAESYLKAAEVLIAQRAASYDVNNSYIEAARCYIKTGSVDEGIGIMELKALPSIIDEGSLIRAAKLYTEMANVCLDEKEKAIKYFEEAARYYQMENATTTYIASLEQVATLSCQIDTPNYNRSIELFASIGKEAADNQNLKYQTTDYFFNCIILCLAKDDIVCATNYLEEFANIYYPFTNTREYKLLQDIICVYPDNNVTAFTDAVFNYDQISRLNPWRTSILLTIKNNMNTCDVNIL